MGNLIIICGGLLILEPSYANWRGVIFVLVSAFFSALTNFGLARAAMQAHFVGTVFLTSVIQAVALIPLAIAEGFSISDGAHKYTTDIFVVAASGCASLAVFACMVQAYRTAPVSETVSAEHLRIPMAMGASAIMLDIALSLKYVIGCVVMLTGLFVSIRFSRSKRNDYERILELREFQDREK